MVIVMPMGPLIYFYVCSCLDASFRTDRKKRLHFLPVLIDLAPALIALVFFAGASLGWLIPNPEPWGIFIDEFNKYADIPRWLSMTIYVGLTAKKLHSYRLVQQGLLKGPDTPMYTWLRQFTNALLVFVGIWFLYMVPYVLPAYSNRLIDRVGWYPVYIPLAILIYWLGIKGYLVSQAAASLERKKRMGAVLPSELVDKTIASLKQAMDQEKRYLDPALNISTLAQHTGYPAKTLSIVLNQYIGKSFSEYLNEYRVSEFKQRIMEPGHGHLTITGIAFECGFNSQASFQRIFKQTTGMSPSEFRNKRAAID
jgi:AraC-like DNA-binding protein